MKLGKDFWEWASQPPHTLPCRGPRGDPKNKERVKVMGKLRHEWSLLQKEKASGQGTD
jgi:hypothetical protein